MKISHLVQPFSSSRLHRRGAPAAPGDGASSIARTLLLLALLWPFATMGASNLPDELQNDFDRLFSSGDLEIQGHPILAGPLLVRFYEQRSYQAAWSDPGKVDQLLALLATASEDGLDPQDYYLSELISLRQRAAETADDIPASDLELLYTESLVRYAYHQRFGKVNPKTLASTWNFDAEFAQDIDPAVTLNEAVTAVSLAEFKDRYIKRGPLYRQARLALQKYRDIAADGRWNTVQAGPTLRIGERDPRVKDVRRRLTATDDLAPSIPANEDLFDQPLDAAVRRFQDRHALEVDGAVGPGTLDAMNVPAAQRIDQLRLVLERVRWLGGAIDPSLVLVNIASAEVRLIEDGQWVWSSRAMVGKTYRQTPIFRGLMTYLDVNPTWTVPPGILRKDILPKVRKDPEYLTRSNISVLDRSGGKVDPQSVDWQNLQGMPYVFRQEPGPDNALGQIKFMFPNEHFIFLHDTPHRELFARSQRTFSSGCIRVQNPFALAALLLRDPEQWSEAAVLSAVATGETRRVRLARPWPVYILYWTAEADDQGRVRFYPDVYARDQALLNALNAHVLAIPL